MIKLYGRFEAECQKRFLIRCCPGMNSMGLERGAPLSLSPPEDNRDQPSDQHDRRQDKQTDSTVKKSSRGLMLTIYKRGAVTREKLFRIHPATGCLLSINSDQLAIFNSVVTQRPIRDRLAIIFRHDGILGGNLQVVQGSVQADAAGAVNIDRLTVHIQNQFGNDSQLRSPGAGGS